MMRYAAQRSTPMPISSRKSLRRVEGSLRRVSMYVGMVPKRAYQYTSTGQRSTETGTSSGTGSPILDNSLPS